MRPPDRCKTMIARIKQSWTPEQIMIFEGARLVWGAEPLVEEADQVAHHRVGD